MKGAKVQDRTVADNTCTRLVERALMSNADLKLNSTTRTRPDPHGPNGVSPQKKVRAGPCGSGRVRVGSV